MKWATGMLVLLVAMVVGAAAESEAPLANTSKELKKLQQDEATRDGSNVQAHLTDGVPDLDTPVPGAVTEIPLITIKSSADLKKKKDLQKNWLIDGVSQLEREDKAKDGKSPANPPPEAVKDNDDNEEKGNHLPEAGDPNYLLKVYAEQQKESESKTPAKSAPGSHVDAFAPFMQAWLGSSPVRGEFFDEFAKQGASSGSLPVVQASSDNSSAFGSTLPDNSFAPKESRSAPAPNPYLQGLDLPAVPESVTAPASGKFDADAFDKAPEIARPTVNIDPIAALAPVDKKLATPQSNEDKKYFPQLKKF